MSDMKPCPFCGKKGRVVMGRLPDRRPVWHVECNLGHRGRQRYSAAEAKADWNTRASPWRLISEAPRDGTWIIAMVIGEDAYEARWRAETGRWEDWADHPVLDNAVFVPMPET